jgi:membrane protease YdiL (CAAX protease family)
MIMAILFGLLHIYQGPVGVILTAWVGLTLGVVFLLNRRNLWLTILTHGLMDTIAFVLLFLGYKA